MTTPVTSPAPNPAVVSGLTDQWTQFFTFLRRPVLPKQATGVGAGSLGGTWRLLILDILLTLGVLGFFYILTLLGVEAPENALAGLDFDWGVIALIVLAAPLTEEILFRGWLSGRPGHVFATLAVALGALAVPIAAGYSGSRGLTTTAGILAGGGALAGAALLAILALWYWRHSGPWRWFAKIFPVLLPLSALLFASVHVLNYEDAISPLLLLFVIPQFLAGLIFGYARVHFGLWSSILLHALHNGTAMAVIVIFAET